MVNKTIAFLWDESFLWGLMSYKALKACNLSFELIRSDDIKKGELKNYRMLFVPGGWASNKMKTLGEKGIGEIKNFVNSGGNYLGFCGGAGLATLDGIGLLNINRMPTKQRVPSFSGRIHLNVNGHPIWNSSLHHSITPSAIFHAWWPSQFLVDDTPIKILATYGDALSDSFSSDLNVGDVEANGGWSELEDIYKINLNPRRLKDAPSVVEGSFGKGKVILSLIHFDTPDDTNGARVLKNLWEYLSGQKSEEAQKLNSSLYYSIAPSILADLESAVDDLISLGTRNFLWFWRNPMLLQWRRGVRGLEYCTLYAMIKEIAEIIKKQQSAVSSQQSDLNKIKELLMPFIENAKRLLILERYAMQNGHITYEKCDDPEIQEMRTELFGNSKSHGGLFKKLIDEVDKILYILLKI
ncbi:MAG: BPL-N domain-containing protein [Nitrospirota bacterium]